jgi:murein DD-endopeptidase MepM/ murein hydrolase activator NlpD
MAVLSAMERSGETVPQASRNAWPVFATRTLIALFVIALLFTASAGFAQPAAGVQLGDQISSSRRSQRYYESAMRAQDKVLAQVKYQQRITKNKLKRAQKKAKSNRRRHAAASRIVRIRKARLAKAEARFPDAAEAPHPVLWRKKMQRLRQSVRVAQKRKATYGRNVRRATWARRARHRKLLSLRRVRRAAIPRREAAEGALAAHIVRMTHLAQQRASAQSGVTLVSGSTFAWPSEGTITQRFGCTGVRFNPRRGSCRHFHDGIDMVSAHGSLVRSAAVGVVAYVGWNPWDESGRAFIVVVGHPNGYVTRYGHLVPNKKVRVGQLVRKGRPIGQMGNTGFSTGTHLHMELLRGNTPLDPVSFLPSSGAKYKEAKQARKKAKASKRKKARVARRKATTRRHANRNSAPSSRASDPFAAICESNATQASEVFATPDDAEIVAFLAVERGAPGGASGSPTAAVNDGSAGACEPTEPSTQGRLAATSAGATGRAIPRTPVADEIGYPMPLRGTSPTPQ